MIEAFGLSDPGCVRTNNEDYFISDAEAGIFILADGVGGANAGEHASHLSAESLYRQLLRNIPVDGLSQLDEAFVEANKVVREAGRLNLQLQGMGTTLLVARSLGESRFEIGSVGDSRAYLCSQGLLTLLTEDQTWLAEVGLRSGLSEEALKRHPMRHVLTMAVGSTEELRVFSRLIEVTAGDQLLLCSDGLHGVLPERILGEIIRSDDNLPGKCRSLIEAVKSAGAPDNVTVVLIQVV